MPHMCRNSFLTAQIRDLIHEDVTVARDDADLSQRLARNSYGFRDTDQGRVLVTLPHQVPVCPLG